MKTALRYTISGTAPARSDGTNCGRNAKKKIVSLGLRVLTRIPDTITRHGEAFTGSVSIANTDLSRNVFHAR